MSADIYLKFDGIEGESSDSKHPGWIEIQNINLGISLPASNSSYSSSGGGTNTGRSDFDPITFSKYMDKSSVKISEFCATGKTDPKVEIHLCQAGDGDEKHVFMEYILKDAVFTNYSVSASMHDVDRPMESIAIIFSNIEMSYKDMTDKGFAGAAAKFEYSLKENKKV
jgi:type VI secretion system secreted protein Hcp